MYFVDCADARHTPPPVLRTAAPSRTFANPAAALWRRAPLANPLPRRVKLLLEPSRAALPAITVALGAHQILAQLRVLTLQFSIRLSRGSGFRRDASGLLDYRGARIPRVSDRHRVFLAAPSHAEAASCCRWKL